MIVKNKIFTLTLKCLIYVYISQKFVYVLKGILSIFKNSISDVTEFFARDLQANHLK